MIDTRELKPEMIQNDKFWAAVAMGMEAENEKMEVFVRHKESRGVAREAILRNLLRSQTRAPYIVTTGFVCDKDIVGEPSNQSDVLVYNPEQGRPYYAIDEFSVVPDNAAAFIFEVKSYLDEQALVDAIGVKESVRKYEGRILRCPGRQPSGCLGRRREFPCQ